MRAGDRIRIRTVQGRYLVVNALDDIIVVGMEPPGDNGIFTIGFDEGRIWLRHAQHHLRDGHWVDRPGLRFNGRFAARWEQFDLTYVGENRFTLRSAHGHFMDALENEPVTSMWGLQKETGVFSYEVVDPANEEQEEI